MMIGPAGLQEAWAIAEMSRTEIEHGLSWRYRPTVIARHIRAPDVEVVVAREGQGLIGFAVMELALDEAHLVLFAVSPHHRRTGVGRALLEYLEKMAEVAMIGSIRLEVRRINAAARAFYRAQGFREVGVLRAYYDGREDAVRMERSLVPKTTRPGPP